MPKRECKGAHTSSSLHYVWEQHCPSETARVHIHRLFYTMSESSTAQARLQGCTYIVFPILYLRAAMPKRECKGAHTLSSLHYIWEQQCPSENAKVHIHRLPYTISGSSNAKARLHGCTYIVFPLYVWEQQCQSKTACVHNKVACKRVR